MGRRLLRPAGLATPSAHRKFPCASQRPLVAPGPVIRVILREGLLNPGSVVGSSGPKPTLITIKQAQIDGNLYWIQKKM